ncbi:GNAT family N-acetyltransferase [Methyloligella sp. 2.7D]|uniref:GNAT family N-acetyltransferase n=1 Tax=unclassified Methyloligella TaxID=2625955 RepID=UPI00157D797F|nr:GNAT family N-acetyltransferase [Methyloligella sp. GL2]QKP77199.1 GNAT family N-acetyltransferase [Methyloligella sp. GL2]
MSAQAVPDLAVRPMLPGETPALAEIFRESVMQLTSEEYSEDQQEAWVEAADDPSGFAEMLERQVTIVVTLNGSPVGFASLESDEKIGLFYVHPVTAGHGVGTLLADALERLAASRDAETLSVDASDTAFGFFARRGYVPQQRNQVQRGDAWLANTTMMKDLDDGESLH